jgi:hypothetical protein
MKSTTYFDCHYTVVTVQHYFPLFPACRSLPTTSNRIQISDLLHRVQENTTTIRALKENELLLLVDTQLH